ncbi:MAG: hypothetical protein ACRCZI_05795 [Cetobacterium sp.]
MGANISKQKVLNKTLNDVAIEVLNRNSTTLGGVIDQSNKLIINNSKLADLTNITQLNYSKINVNALSQSISNNTLQADLINSLKSAVEKESPVLGIGNNSEQDIENTIGTIIRSTITNESLHAISAQVKQDNSIILTNVDSITGDTVVQKNEADLILGLVNEATSKIALAVTASNTTDSKASDKTAPLVDLGIGGAGIIVLLIILVIVGGGFYYLSTMTFQDMVTKPVPLMVISAIALSLIGGIIFAVSSGDDEKKEE